MINSILFKTKGLLKLKISENKLIPCSWLEWAVGWFKFFVISDKSTINSKIEFAKGQVKEIQGLIDSTNANSADLKFYTAARKTIERWNEVVGKHVGTISYKELFPVQMESSAFPSDSFEFFVTNAEKLPLIIRPKNDWNLQDFQDYLRAHQEEIKELIDKSGAIMFRGFPIKTADDFRETLAAALGKAPSDYVGSGFRGKKKAEAVLPSTDAPKEFSIPLHSERLFTHTPSYISFFCLTPPNRGTGQTTLGSALKINAALKEKGVWDYFAAKDSEGLKIDQMMTYPSKGTFYTLVNPAHKSWQQVFGKETKEEVIEILEQHKIEFNKERFLEKGTLEVHEYAPIFRERQSDGRVLWESIVHQFHHNARKHGGWFIHLLVNMLYPFQHLRMFNAQFTDGSKIPQDKVYQIYDALEENTLATTDWQQGDMTIVSNEDVWHGRAPSTGQREILAAVVL